MKKILICILAFALIFSVFSCAAEEVQLYALTDSPLMTGPGYTDEHVEIDCVSAGDYLPYKGLSFADDGSVWYFTSYYGIAGYVLAENMQLVAPEPSIDEPTALLQAKNADTISAGYVFTVAIKNDGTAVGVGDNSRGQLNISSWTDLVSISGGAYHTVGLKSDGTVVAAGDNRYGQCSVSYWNDIIAVSAGKYHTVGLKSDGTVLAVGSNDDGQLKVNTWKNIVMISAGSTFTLAIDANGKAYACGLYDVDSYGAGVPSEHVKFDYHDIVMIDANQTMMGGVRSDNTIVLDGYSRYSIDWQTIEVAEEIAIGGAHVLVKTYRDVVFGMGANGNGQCNTMFWDDIASIDAGALHSIALKKDGTMLATGNNDYGQCNVAGLTDIRLPENS